MSVEVPRFSEKEYSLAWHLGHVINRTIELRIEAAAEVNLDRVIECNLNLQDLNEIVSLVLPDIDPVVDQAN